MPWPYDQDGDALRPYGDGQGPYAERGPVRDARRFIGPSRLIEETRRRYGSWRTWTWGALPDGGAQAHSEAVRRAAALLGVAVDASKDEIKSAFRKAARKTHADVGGSDDKMRALIEARELLGG